MQKYSFDELMMAAAVLLNATPCLDRRSGKDRRQKGRSGACEWSSDAEPRVRKYRFRSLEDRRQRNEGFNVSVDQLVEENRQLKEVLTHLIFYLSETHGARGRRQHDKFADARRLFAGDTRSPERSGSVLDFN